MLDKPYMDSEDLNRLLATNLRSLKEEKSLNDSAWAKAAGMGHTAVRDILLMKTKNPTYRTLLKLAEVAGVDVRRITVGPDFLKADQVDAELAAVLSELEPAERQFVLNAAKGQIDGRNQSPEKSDEDVK